MTAVKTGRTIFVIIAVLLFGFNANASVEFSDGSVKTLYHFANDVIDSSGNGNNGTATDITYSAGKLDNAGIFNGSTSKIEFNSLPIAGTGAMSYNVWLKTGTNARQGIIFVGGQGTREAIILYIYTDYKLHVDLPAQGGPSCTASITDNNWHMATVVLTGTSLKLYLDNNLCGDTTLGGSYNITNTVAKHIGLEQASNYFTGSVDELSAFNIALNQDQVGSLWNEGNGNEICTTAGCASGGTGTTTPELLSSTTPRTQEENVKIIVYILGFLGTFFVFDMGRRYFAKEIK